MNEDHRRVKSEGSMLRDRPTKAKSGRARSKGQRPAAPLLPHGPENSPVVGIGASAGGLEACTKLLDALPPDKGMAFILVQHLDPTHESMMAELLAHHTSMTVVQATSGMLVEPNHLYIIPPGSYLSAGKGALHLSEPEARHGARLPFDFLLRSLAEEYGERAICVILSGTGADGSLGLKAVKEKGGLVIAQDPEEAAFDGMPRNAILTGAVDLVLPLASIPDALTKFHRRMALTRAAAAPHEQHTAPDWLPEIIDLLRKKTAHDFRLYKEGTLRRRIERRMAMASIETDDIERYVDVLKGNETELARLAMDLLINVTSFFRDPKVFDVLSKKIVPDLVRSHSIDQPLRIWIAGCSTGEETYSLAMLFREEITAAKREIKLQIFASDVDADAVATAREGLYPETIAAEVSPERLARFFSKDDHGYRILPELRATIVFAVQDVLADPPFSRLDLVSCRNLLIYLRQEAQEKVIAFFHFALREGGILLLGSAETIGASKGRFEVISKAERHLSAHVGHTRPGEAGFFVRSRRWRAAGGSPAFRSQTSSRQGRARRGLSPPPYRDLCAGGGFDQPEAGMALFPGTNRALSAHTPRSPELRPARHGASASPEQAQGRDPTGPCWSKSPALSSPEAGQTTKARLSTFQIAVQPALIDGEDLLLVCFVDDPAPVP